MSTYGRKAFGPGRKSTPERLAVDIACSILTHRAEGRVRCLSQYTRDPELIKLVRAHMLNLVRPPQPEAVQVVRAEQQAWLDATLTGIK